MGPEDARPHSSPLGQSASCDQKTCPSSRVAFSDRQDEPFGGLPTLAYARVFEEARRQGVIVLLDGQGLDEQWAGYEYYGRYLSNGRSFAESVMGPVQGCKEQPVRPECLSAEFRDQAQPLAEPAPFTDRLRNRQYLDALLTKIPRALRFNDRVSMRSSTELREPFLDHRMFELALRQLPERKIAGGVHKSFLRQMTRSLLPANVVEAQKRPLQTPQREWLRGPLKEWTADCIDSALAAYGNGWFNRAKVQESWQEYQQGNGSSSFHIWQWINLGLWKELIPDRKSSHDRTGHAIASAVLSYIPYVLW